MYAIQAESEEKGQRFLVNPIKLYEEWEEAWQACDQMEGEGMTYAPVRISKKRLEELYSKPDVQFV